VDRIYDDQDNVISPIMAVILFAVAFGVSRQKLTLAVFSSLIAAWLFISIVTDGSGLFAGKSLLAPILFLILIAAIFGMLLHWLLSAKRIDSEVICAAVCGYLLLGLLWSGLDAIALLMDPKAFVATSSAPVAIGDLLYFSYSTLTTVAFGDITPKNPFIRMAAVLEACVGIFYNIIVLARIVGLYGFSPNTADNSVREGD
jgi:hypothetical protein